MADIRNYIPAMKWGFSIDDVEIGDLDEINDSNGNEILEFDSVSSAVNHIGVVNASTGNNPQVQAKGESDTGLTFASEDDEEMLILDAVAGAVNEVTIRSAATGAKPIIAATGEADTGLEFHNDQAEEGLIVDFNATAVNEVTIDNAATGSGPTISATGDDTNINLELAPKGSGTVNIDDDDNLTVNSVIVPVYETVTVGPIAQASISDREFFIANQSYKLVAASCNYQTAESAGTVNIQIERLQSTEAVGGNGDALLTNNANAGFDGTATAKTVQNGTLVTDGSEVLSAGDRLALDFTGDVPGELDQVIITVDLERQ